MLEGRKEERGGHAPVLLWTSLWVWAGRTEEDRYSSLASQVRKQTHQHSEISEIKSQRWKSRVQREDIRAAQRETKPGMAAPTHGFTTGEAEAGYVKFGVSLGYTVSSRSTSTTVLNLNNETI